MRIKLLPMFAAAFVTAFIAIAACRSYMLAGGFPE
jgi:hypothetical protein